MKSFYIRIGTAYLFPFQKIGFKVGPFKWRKIHVWEIRFLWVQIFIDLKNRQR